MTQDKEEIGIKSLNSPAVKGWRPQGEWKETKPKQTKSPKQTKPTEKLASSEKIILKPYTP